MERENKEKGKTENRKILFFGGMVIAGAALIIIYLVFTGNTPQMFYDVVNEYTALHGSNKSAEKNLFYILSFLGIISYTLYFFITQKVNSSRIAASGVGENGYIYIILALVVFTGTYYFVYLEISPLLLVASLFSLLIMLVDKKEIISGISFFFVCIYSVYAIYRVYVFAGGEKSLSIATVALISLAISSGILFVNRNHKTGYVHGVMIAQVLIPFSLLIFLVSKYKYKEEYLVLHIPYRVQILIGLFIIAFVIEAILIALKNWKKKGNSVGDIISYGVCISIMAFNRYSGSGAIISSDLHHPYENIIGYSQMLELGQKAFSEYIPVSGMYSVIQGFFLSFFGYGQMAYYFLTQNIFYLFVITIIVALLRKQVKGEWALFISMVFLVLDYNRIAFILPTMLLLAYPKLIENKNLWLKCWYLSSFFQGLYYPVFGAAVCMGYFPLGIWQIISYVKSETFKRDIKQISFWMWWAVCSIPVMLGIPYLLGTIRHMKAMGGQTIYADGISRFGQVIADNFLPYIQDASLRLIMYYVFSFLIVVSIVWVSVALFLKLGNVQIKNKKIIIEKPIPAYIALSLSILMLISFSYTVIRMDPDDIYARSAGTVFVSFVMFVVVSDNFIVDNKVKKYVLAFAVFLIAAVSGEGFLFVDTRVKSDAHSIENFSLFRYMSEMSASAKLDAHYTVPEGYVYVENDPVEKLGTCFVLQSVYDSIEGIYNSVQNLDREESYFGIVSFFGYYYLCDIKGDSVMESYTIKGKDAAQETIDLIQKQKTIVGPGISSINNYYFYHWLLTSGAYVWSEENLRFEPNDGTVSLNEILLRNKNMEIAADGASLGRTAGSWGLSMDSLKSIFSSPGIAYSFINTDNTVQAKLKKVIDGDEADFAYLEFAEMDNNYEYILFNLEEAVVQDTDKYPFLKYLAKRDYNRDLTVVVSWRDEAGNSHSMNCAMGQGKLLIPLGGGRGWLLNKHSEISINVINQNGETVAVPDISNLEFLKLREVE
ncbi:hypothetical protein C805_00477 [Eubacterium sp. 14-2]|uniref:hypothetical protein n=1 Tax=Eubacterium sp. 14-2 TaxID=1235790 RepID=UPI00033921F2|nr:hypothetical protein [Eubacterium sp. 14-2]EOT28335.1 hypothetical protein C805_00477 [Eubacterium sp. 14-2]